MNSFANYNLHSLLEAKEFLATLRKCCFAPFDIYFDRQGLGSRKTRIHKKGSYLGIRELKRIDSNLHKFYVNRSDLNFIKTHERGFFHDILKPTTFELKQKNVRKLINKMRYSEITVENFISIFHLSFSLRFSDDNIFEHEIYFFEFNLLSEVLILMMFGKTEQFSIQKYVHDYRGKYITALSKLDALRPYQEKIELKLGKSPLDFYNNRDDIFWSSFENIISGTRVFDQILLLEDAA